MRLKFIITVLFFLPFWVSGQTNESIEELTELYNQLLNEYEVSPSTQMRRTLTIVYDRIVDLSGNNVNGINGLNVATTNSSLVRSFEVPPCRRHPRPRPGLPRRQEPFGPENFVMEFQVDDRRRSISLDTQEILTKNILDFNSGRVNDLELRSGNMEELMKEINIVESQIETNTPILQFNRKILKSDQDILEYLDKFKSLILSKKYESESEFEKDVVSKEQILSCKLDFTGIEYVYEKANTEAYEVVFDEFKCERRHPCCGNLRWTRHRKVRSKTLVWRNGDIGNHPPTTPPPLKPEPWNNKLPFFEDTTVGMLTSNYGYRNLLGERDWHWGIDVWAKVGTEVRSVDSGRVIKIERNSPGNNHVVIKKGKRYYWYLHIEPSADLREGRIQSGKVIGKIEQREGAHLHYSVFEIQSRKWEDRSDENSINPFEKK